MNKIFRLLVALAVVAMVACNSNGKTVYVQDYITEDMTEDAYPGIRLALEEALKSDNSTLVFPGGTLNIKDTYCFEKYQYISNNTQGKKRIAINLEGVEGLTIEGNGTTLLFTGFISPFNVENSNNITISDLNIDFTHTFNSQGEIMAVGQDWMELKFPENYNVDIQSGQLRIRDKNNITYPYGSLLEFDSKKMEVAHYVHDYWLWSPLQAEKLPNGNFKIFLKDITGTVGNIMAFGAARRSNPGFTFEECNTVLIKNVNLYHCGGMGFIVQKVRDIELNNVQVVPTPGSNRVISATADATHFINCGGYLRMIDCKFTNQKDDATNIHGWYAMTREKVADDKILVWYNYGKDFIRPGMNMEIVNHKTMMTYAYRTVKEVRSINSEFSEITFTEDLPEEIQIKDAIACDDQYPDVLIKGCHFANNRARGLLIGSRGEVIIEDNYFHVPGAAVLFEGDGSYWYEQSGVRNVQIRNNVFDNCLYGCKTWGDAHIAYNSRIAEQENSRYHKNIVIENNTFRTFDPRILYLCCFDGITYRNNKIEHSTDYEFGRDVKEPFVIKHCDNVNIE
ncbi:MAG: right-handed parallel beta-helix repeat-containing protein [Rikenellaceae bacterium]|nr:right-handed parallel beta-helix repeat-containing protein [Rikenellaceae bacterium]